jgi:FtsZ-binding cell division protein ZapB
MINLEQVKLLETKVARAVDYVDRLAKENAVLRRQEAEMQTKMESYQKRIDELEVLVTGFKDDQDRIEEGILSALDRLSKFEKAMEKTLREKPAKAARETAAADTAEAEAAMAEGGSGEGQTCFEIPEEAAEGDSPHNPNGGELDIF